MVNCRRCWARPGQPCTRKNGTPLASNHYHPERKKSARDKLGTGRSAARESREWPHGAG